jgi:CPA2 family monovalent cation:H+ antiporter-2
MIDPVSSAQLGEHLKDVGEQVGILDELALVLGVSLPLGMLAARLRLPAIVGFLAAGVILGPHVPYLIADVHLAEKLGEIGVIFLMFGVGLHFSVKDLLAVKRIAVPGAIVQSLVATAGTMVIAQAFRWPLGAGLVLGLSLSVASTVVLVRALTEQGELESSAGKIAVGWLVVEDLFSALILVLLPILAVSLGGNPPDVYQHDTLRDALFKEGDSVLAYLARHAGFTATPLTLVVLTLLNVGLLAAAMPWIRRATAGLFAGIERTGSSELFTLTAVSVALVIAFGSMALFGVSIALGAFAGGVVVAAAPQAHRIAEDLRPFKDLFGVVFFAAVGMLFNPHTLVEMPLHVLAVVGVIMVVKPAVAAGLARAFGQSAQTSMVIAAGLSQIGEFSFILATLGRSLGLIPDAAYQLVITGAIISIALNRLMFGVGRRMVPSSAVNYAPL